MIGVIAVAGWERFKGATRADLCLRRARLARHAALRDVVVAATRALSVLPAELPAAVVKLQAELKDAAKASAALRQELAGFQAIELRTKAETIGPYRGVLMAQPGEDAAVLKTLAAAIVSEPGFIVVFDGAGALGAVVAGGRPTSPSTPAHGSSGHNRVRRRGGGRPEQAQGGIDAAPDR